MHIQDKAQFENFLSEQGIKQHKNPTRQYEWNDALEAMPGDTEILPFFTRSKSTGIMFYDDGENIRSLTFEVSKKPSGMTRASICDLCQTQRSNGDVRIISFYKTGVHIAKQLPTGWLCCKDLLCSAHVRNMTDASLVSRAQLRETELNKDYQQIPLSIEAMIGRLRRNTLRLLSLVTKN